ncbi:MAG: hypothetical protein HDR87_04805 [Bacteroides sp.]|nr:hypothetical protein [Bacteroides sp.]MBD5360011.1 hypothetical protein [Bacteroides sp.]MBD5362935.1 hypothetical protein [Bacteroides sp.]MBD5372250.1 hypothetical protein [Bacteroides sp.]
MQNSALTRIANAALPALSGSSLTYNAEKNVYLTLGYTSAAGNTYFQAVRFSDRLAVYYDVGQGYSRTFLNGITLFAWDGNKATIIGRKMWGGYDNWVFFDEAFAKKQTIKMLKDYLEGQAKMIGQVIPEHQLIDFSTQLIDDVHNYQKRLA